MNRRAISVVVLCLFFILGFTACAQEVSKVGGTEPAKPAQTPAEKPVRTEYERADRVKIGDVVTQVTAAAQATPSNEYVKPEEGKVFYMVGLKIVNEGTQPENYNQFNYKMEDATGNQTNATYMGDIPTPLNSGSLAPGGFFSGNLVFQVPADMANLKLIIEPNIFSKQQVKIKL